MWHISSARESINTPRLWKGFVRILRNLSTAQMKHISHCQQVNSETQPGWAEVMLRLPGANLFITTRKGLFEFFAEIQHLCLLLFWGFFCLMVVGALSRLENCGVEAAAEVEKKKKNDCAGSRSESEVTNRNTWCSCTVSLSTVLL